MQNEEISRQEGRRRRRTAAPAARWLDALLRSGVQPISEEPLKARRPRRCAFSCLSSGFATGEEPNDMWRGREMKGGGEGAGVFLLPRIGGLSHCSRRAFFMLHCNRIRFPLVFSRRSPLKDLRRPETLIHITGCPSPPDV